MSKLKSSAVETCAQLLLQARRKHFRMYDLPLSIRPQTLEDGYRVQARLAELLCSSPNQLRRIGYKAANTNETSQKFLGLPQPFFGPLLARDDASVVGTKAKPKVFEGISKLGVRICEPEFALQVGSNGKVINVAPAIEIVHTSFLNWKVVGAPSLVADLACNGYWIRGDSVPVDKITFRSCALFVNGRQVSKGDSSKVLGSPLNVLEAFRTHNRQTAPVGGPLKDGDWLTTGVCVDPPYHVCEPGDEILVEFEGGIGSVALSCRK